MISEVLKTEVQTLMLEGRHEPYTTLRICIDISAARRWGRNRTAIPGGYGEGHDLAAVLRLSRCRHPFSASTGPRRMECRDSKDDCGRCAGHAGAVLGGAELSGRQF